MTNIKINKKNNKTFKIIHIKLKNFIFEKKLFMNTVTRVRKQEEISEKKCKK